MLELSIVVPTLNRTPYLLPLLDQLLRQDGVDFEVWVLDQGEETGAGDVRRRLEDRFDDPRLHYVHLPVRGVANARNEGLARARGEIVLFLDDDVILLADTFLRAHLDRYADPDVGAVVGRVVERSIRANTRRTRSKVTIGGRTVENLLGTEPVRLQSVKGANVSFRAEVFRFIGGFDRNYIGTSLLEEADVAARVMRDGWQLVYEPGAELFHLSAPLGGVRVEDAMRTEHFRFRSTAYFVRKNRGLLGLAPFFATFALIALARAAAWRRPSAAWRLFAGVREGLRAARKGPDQAIARSDPASAAALPGPAPALRAGLVAVS